MARNGGEEFGGSVRGICVQRREAVAGTRASPLTEMTAGNPGLILWGTRLRRSADFVSRSLRSLCRLEQADVRSCDLD